jgi:hypothetical protein
MQDDKPTTELKIPKGEYTEEQLKIWEEFKKLSPEERKRVVNRQRMIKGFLDQMDRERS